jgi:hypothetical protein
MTASSGCRATPTVRNPIKTREIYKSKSARKSKNLVATDELEDKTLKFLGWKGPKTGERLIDEAAKAFKRDGKTS